MNKKYKFTCGITANQQPLTIGESRKLYSAIKKLFPAGEAPAELKLTDILDKIVEGNMLNELFSIILKSTDSNPDYDKLTLDEAAEVLTDFFTLNKKVMSLLGIGASAPAGLSATPKSATPNS